MKRSRSNPWPWVGLGLLLLLVVGGLGLATIAVMMNGESAGSGRVGLIEYSGVVSDEGASSVFGISQGGARDFIKQVERARRDKTIKAVVIRVNSPGGSPSASQEMFQAIRRLRDKKPVICSMGDAAASGGYYIAAACDTIYANPSTITGSIGVISSSLNFSNLIQKWGIKDTTTKSGRYKDLGNPFRPIDPAHEQWEKGLIQNIYSQFVGDILVGRKNKLTRQQLLKLADGRVFTGEQAQKNGLVDHLGGLHDAIEAAAKLGKVKSDDAKGGPPVKKFSEGGFFGSLETEASATNPIGQAATQLSNGFAATLGRAFADALVERLKLESQTPALPQAR